ncbi:hypothetical protein [Streptomyces sp. 4F14]|uniref:hypothetical protein n=1 Tax=Streptomyces sp. 4F14 TaxID=3394380 RepID=UPI003A8AEEE8
MTVLATATATATATAPPASCRDCRGRAHTNAPTRPRPRHDPRNRDVLSGREAAEAVRRAKVKTGGTWAQLAEAAGKPLAWTTAALLGLGDDAALAFRLQPIRGALDTAVPVDPQRVPDPAGDRADGARATEGRAASTVLRCRSRLDESGTVREYEGGVPEAVRNRGHRREHHDRRQGRCRRGVDEPRTHPGEDVIGTFGRC